MLKLFLITYHTGARIRVRAINGAEARRKAQRIAKRLRPSPVILTCKQIEEQG